MNRWIKSAKLLGLGLAMMALSSATRQGNDPITGTWKGTSICQVKNSPCHDEIAIYHAVKLAGGNVYRFQMNKMVNGQEEEMGLLDFTYDAKEQLLTAENKARTGMGHWKFKLDGKSIHGTLIIDPNTLYRIIEITKAD